MREQSCGAAVHSRRGETDGMVSMRTGRSLFLSRFLSSEPESKLICSSSACKFSTLHKVCLHPTEPQATFWFRNTCLAAGERGMVFIVTREAWEFGGGGSGKVVVISGGRVMFYLQRIKGSVVWPFCVHGGSMGSL